MKLKGTTLKTKIKRCHSACDSLSCQYWFDWKLESTALTGWPEGGYRGDYIEDVARAYLAGATSLTANFLPPSARDS
ncbi:hypothetical protein LQE85_12040 [Stenotrophomonas rhizophila]|uniref:hypothetical protein n=1 Tax=Stenotrophomonas rhizophila TaxID=216778 RepID=UPI00201CB3D5|nr:hypothetical protein [Stenotrophomonas rhizophila]UQY86231.1 hypothetical protein LQE85_12040 [Stenotrophomonas rhizophila]